jgi:hypothetical protein
MTEIEHVYPDMLQNPQRPNMSEAISPVCVERGGAIHGYRRPDSHPTILFFANPRDSCEEQPAIAAAHHLAAHAARQHRRDRAHHMSKNKDGRAKGTMEKALRRPFR